jgi:MFS family permease
MPATTRAPRRIPARAALIAISVAAFIAASFSSAPAALYPAYVEVHHWSMLDLTISFAVFSIGVIVTLALAGQASDRLGRRPVMLVGLALEIASAALLAISPAFGIVVTARVLGGAGIGLIAPSVISFIADLLRSASPNAPATRARLLSGFALLGGFAVGPLVAGALASSEFTQTGEGVLFTLFSFSLIALLFALGAVFVSPETVALPQTPAVMLPLPLHIAASARAKFSGISLAVAAACSILGLYVSVVPVYIGEGIGAGSPSTVAFVAFTASGAFAVGYVANFALSTRLQFCTGVLLVALGAVCSAVANTAGLVPPFITAGVVAGFGGGLLVRPALVAAAALAGPRKAAHAKTTVLMTGLLGFALPVVALGIATQVTSVAVATTGFAAVPLALLAVSTVKLASRATAVRRLTFASPGQSAFRKVTSAYEIDPASRPEHTTVARSVADVVSAVSWARRSALRIRLHATGHASGSAGSLAGSLLMHVDIDEPITVNPELGEVRIPAGTRWGEVVATLAPYGLGVPHGSSPDVGAIGYLLRGGVSFYGRTTGLAINSVRSIELVLADGTHVIASDSRNQDLFYAIRGGGGGFGVVTAVTVATFPVAAALTGAAIWDVEHAYEIGTIWEKWSRTAPRSASTSLRIMRLPGLPGLPGSITGKPVINIDGAIVAHSEAERAAAQSALADLLEPLRAVATPLLDSWREGTVLDVSATHMDPPVLMRSAGDHLMVRELGSEGIEAFLDVALGKDMTLGIIELRQLGGAIAVRPSDAGALGSLAGAHIVFATSLVNDKNLDGVMSSLATVRGALTPWDTGFTAPTFVNTATQPQRSFDAATARKVDQIRRGYDPAGIFADDVARGAISTSSTAASLS